MRYSRPRTAGFTLLELLIALSIFALVSVIAFSGLQASIDSRERTTIQADRLVAIQKAFNFMRQDFEQAVNRPVRDQLGQLDPQNAFQTALDGIALTRAGRYVYQFERSSLERIAYGVKDGKLIRGRWDAVDPSNEPNIDELELLEDVESVAFRFLTADKEWVEQWPPLNTGGQAAQLPHAVDVALELADYGAINRIFVLPY